jgi:O-acetyl-ADP-ribose deacetylase (regulator of RNase III)
MTQSCFEDRVVVVVGDLTRENVDVIVNAANSSLLGGGGVDGAIHRAGGPQILQECQKIRNTRYPDGLPTGEAVITSGGNLPARHVIHTVGPIYGDAPERASELLAAAYRNSLALAVQHTLTSIAFPSISTGVYGYPKPEAAAVSSRAIKEFLNVDQSVHQVRLVFFHDADARVFLAHHELE